jgi:translation initiation factor eIF-2B subunit delta
MVVWIYFHIYHNIVVSKIINNAYRSSVPIFYYSNTIQKVNSIRHSHIWPLSLSLSFAIQKIKIEMPDPYASEFTETLHPDVIELGLKYASGDIQGDNERCRAMMECFLNVLNDYILPTSNDDSNNNNNDVIDFRHHFDHQVLKPSFQFWTVNCRPHSVSMGNAFTFLKTAVGCLEREITLEDAKLELTETIERYLQERLEYADRAIAQHALSKIHNGDVLLTFGYSEVIDVLLKTAHEEAHIKFYVWIVDARPLMEGKRLLKSLRAVGISCGYIQLNALTYVMQKQVTKVFLGASALLVNGSIYGQIGTACIALLAKNHHVPVLVCCETYKISNKVQLESITQNELGNPNDLLLLDNTNNNKNDENVNNNNNNKLNAANILYDVTPDKFISGIITELGIIPPTSVAVLLREMNMLNDRAY